MENTYHVTYDPAVATWHQNLFHVTFTVQGIPVSARESIEGPCVKLDEAVSLGTRVVPQGTVYSFQLVSDGNAMLASCFVGGPVRIASPVVNSIDSAVCGDGIFPAQTFAVLIRLFSPIEWARVVRGVERPMQQLMFDHVRPRPLTELERRNLAMLHGKTCGHKGDISFMLRDGSWILLLLETIWFC